MMKRFARFCGLVWAGVLPAASFFGAPVSSAASNNGDTSFPLSDGTNLEMHVGLNCPLADHQCYLTTQADRNGPDGVEGFPNDLWARQTTTLRSSNQLNYLESQVVATNTRTFKEGGKQEITTIYFGGGPVDKYRITGQIQPTNWQTGQPMLNADVIACAQIQVVYTGVNITSPSTCAQTTFS